MLQNEVCACAFMDVCVFDHPTHLCRPSQPSWHCFTSNAINSLWVQLFIICKISTGFFLSLFNQGLDPMLRGLFSCETRPCRPRLTTHILNRVSSWLTNELRSHTNGTEVRSRQTEALSFTIKLLYTIVLQQSSRDCAFLRFLIDSALSWWSRAATNDYFYYLLSCPLFFR